MTSDGAFADALPPAQAAEALANRLSLTGAKGVFTVVASESAVVAFVEALEAREVSVARIGIQELDPAPSGSVVVVSLGDDERAAVRAAGRLNAARQAWAAERLLVLHHPSRAQPTARAMSMASADLRAWSIGSVVLQDVTETGADREILATYAERAARAWSRLDLQGLLAHSTEDRPVRLTAVYRGLRGRRDPFGAEAIIRTVQLQIAIAAERYAESQPDAQSKAAASSAAGSGTVGELADHVAETATPYAPSPPQNLEIDASPLSELMTPRTVVLGDPGCGKTTFLRIQAIEAAEAFLESHRGPRGTSLGSVQAGPPSLEHHRGPRFAPADGTSLGSVQAGHRVPFLCPVADAANHPGGLAEGILDHAEYLAGQLPGLRDAATRALREGRGQLFLDGLDEAPTAERRRTVTDAVRRLSEALPNTPIWVTSRLIGYEPGRLGAEFLEVAVEPFTSEDAKAFLNGWFREAGKVLGWPEAEAEARSDALFGQIAGSPGLTELARTPLLLTLVALAARTGVRLPERRVELYAHLTHVLLERWSAVRSLSGMDAGRLGIAADRAVRLLGPIARWMHEGADGGTVARAVMVERLAAAIMAASPGRAEVGSLPPTDDDHRRRAEEMLNAATEDAGLLSAVGPDSIRFTHRTFLEYFAARDLVRRRRELLKLVRDPRWVFRAENRELVLLAAGQIGIVQVEDEGLVALAKAMLAAEASPKCPGGAAVGRMLMELALEAETLPAKTRIALADAALRRWFEFPCDPMERAVYLTLVTLTHAELLRGLAPRLSARVAGGGVPKRWLETLKAHQRTAVRPRIDTFFFLVALNSLELLNMDLALVARDLLAGDPAPGVREALAIYGTIAVSNGQFPSLAASLDAMGLEPNPRLRPGVRTFADSLGLEPPEFSTIFSVLHEMDSGSPSAGPLTI